MLQEMFGTESTIGIGYFLIINILNLMNQKIEK